MHIRKSKAKSVYFALINRKSSSIFSQFSLHSLGVPDFFKHISRNSFAVFLIITLLWSIILDQWRVTRTGHLPRVLYNGFHPAAPNLRVVGFSQRLSKEL